MGISYGGISQLFTAQTQPPSLAAISPLSVIDNTQTTLYPGGILNTGFAVDWAKERVHDAAAGVARRRAALGLPAHPGGRPDLRGQPGPPRRGGRPAGQDPRQRPLRPDGRRPAVADHVRQQDQTCRRSWPASGPTSRRGGHCPTWPSTSPGPQRKWFTFTNGTHVDSLDPETFNRWYDFLELYVAQQAPIVNSAAIHAAAPVIYQEAMGISGVTLPPDPIQLQPDLRGRAGGLRGAEADPRPLRQRRRQARRPERLSPASSSPSRASRSRAPPRAPGTCRPRGRSRTRRPPPRARLLHVERARPAAHRLHR